jgi:hypothetical protein
MGNNEINSSNRNVSVKQANLSKLPLVSKMLLIRCNVVIEFLLFIYSMSNNYTILYNKGVLYWK